MNIPNILTSIRFALVPLFVMIFFSDLKNAALIALIIFMAAGLTDVLDGYIARKYNMITRWGAILDPLADKLMSITVLLSLTIKEILPLWVLFVIGIKESLMIWGAAVLFNKGNFVSAEVYGKVATVLFYISVLTLGFISRDLGLLFIYITVLAALFALYKYFDTFIRMQKKA